MGHAGSENDPMLEVTFISALIDQLSAEYNLDPGRIYANGLSNGGGMSFTLACMLSERIAAVGDGLRGVPAALGGSATRRARCRRSSFTARADEIVPYLGGPSHAFDLPFPNIPEWVDALAQHNGCTGETIELPANGGVSGIQYTGCAADLIFYTIAGGGHGWPGGEPIPEWIVGPTTHGYRRHPGDVGVFHAAPAGRAGRINSHALPVRRVRSLLNAP